MDIWIIGYCSDDLQSLSTQTQCMSKIFGYSDIWIPIRTFQKSINSNSMSVKNSWIHGYLDTRLFGHALWPCSSAALWPGYQLKFYVSQKQLDTWIFGYQSENFRIFRNLILFLQKHLDIWIIGYQSEIFKTWIFFFKIFGYLDNWIPPRWSRKSLNSNKMFVKNIWISG